MKIEEALPPLSRKDFVPEGEVKWCPGCGDYAILSGFQKLLPELGIPRENFVFVSGIGCSSRFPYYMNTYGFHTIHGRAPAIATGVKLANPGLSVWVITGDGDALSIGGNHFIHALRRNVDLKIVLFNNEIYGLTKGQYSPTSRFGTVTKSSPMGSPDYPFTVGRIAVGAGATFVARTFDVDQEHFQKTLAAAAKHKGTAFVEVWQNCIVFNKGTFEPITEKSARDEQILYLEEGQPLLFGKNKEKAVVMEGTSLKVVEKNQYPQEKLLCHNPGQEDPGLAFLLSGMGPIEFPVPMGILRQVEKPTYGEIMEGQKERAKARAKGEASFSDLFASLETWSIE